METYVTCEYRHKQLKNTHLRSNPPLYERNDCWDRKGVSSYSLLPQDLNKSRSKDSVYMETILSCSVIWGKIYLSSFLLPVNTIPGRAYSPSFGGSAWRRPLAHLGNARNMGFSRLADPKRERAEQSMPGCSQVCHLLCYSTFLGTEGIKWVEGASDDTNLGPFARKNHQKQEKKYFSICNQDQAVYTLCFFPILIYKFKVISIKCSKEFYVPLHKPTKCIWRRKELKIIQRILKENKVRTCPTRYRKLP